MVPDTVAFIHAPLVDPVLAPKSAALADGTRHAVKAAAATNAARAFIDFMMLSPFIDDSCH
jgi:hypothetical protein